MLLAGTRIRSGGGRSGTHIISPVCGLGSRRVCDRRWRKELEVLEQVPAVDLLVVDADIVGAVRIDHERVQMRDLVRLALDLCGYSSVRAAVTVKRTRPLRLLSLGKTSPSRAIATLFFSRLIMCISMYDRTDKGNPSLSE